jgi:Protein of unknown function (DUF4236)
MEMGFYIRKSVKAGPFRFNLSKSGIGTSVGVRGFRVGTGPRGTRVFAGRNGLYYRASLGSAKRRPTQQSVNPIRTAALFGVGFALGRVLFLPLLLIGIFLLIFAWKALLIWGLIIAGIVFVVRRYKGRRASSPAGDIDGMSDAEVAFAEESVGTTFNMFAEDPTPRGVWVIAKAIMTTGGFTERQAGSILGYQFGKYCPSAVPALIQAQQALADPLHHQLDRPLANIRRFHPPTHRR